MEDVLRHIQRGIDKLVVRRAKDSVIKHDPVSLEPIPDLVVYLEEEPQLIEIAPDTFENKLSVPDDLVLEARRGLEEHRDGYFEGELELAVATIEPAGNVDRLIAT